MIEYSHQEDIVGRLVTERSKVPVSGMGAVLPSASGCKEPLLTLVLFFCFLLSSNSMHYSLSDR